MATHSPHPGWTQVSVSIIFQVLESPCLLNFLLPWNITSLQSHRNTLLHPVGRHRAHQGDPGSGTGNACLGDRKENYVSQHALRATGSLVNTREELFPAVTVANHRAGLRICKRVTVSSGFRVSSSIGKVVFVGCLRWWRFVVLSLD